MTHRWLAHLLAGYGAPEVRRQYDDHAARLLWSQYQRCPADLVCPECGTESMQLLAFVEPAVDREGWATEVAPVGEYAAAVTCISCQRGVGLLADPNSN